jgi:hypothetical protein
MNEIWKDVVGFEGFYKVSNFGEVRRIKKGGSIDKSKPLFQSTTHHGYKRTVLQKNGNIKNFFIQRIVAEAFIGPRPENFEVNHINYIRHDNRLENLEYVTKSRNKKHAWEKIKKKYQTTENKKFHVKIWYKNKYLCLGTYNTKDKAINVYDKKHIELFGY